MAKQPNKTATLGVGIIGCGNISTTYFELSPLFKFIEMRACADIDSGAANKRAKEYGVKAQSVEELLRNDDIDIVVNLTVPAVHTTVSTAILEAGKHVYSEKPLTLSVAEGKAMAALADRMNRKVACAPDTILGGSHQQARKTLDDGVIGQVVSGTAHIMGHGMEHWHPNPDFFFKPGGGPILDMGPYYIGNLINLIGPVARVAALSGTARPARTISSAPRRGESIPVETPTTYHALLKFVSGALVTLSASWDVYGHRHQNMELYGTQGAMFVPDPNFFGGEVKVGGTDTIMKPLTPWAHPLGVANQKHQENMYANYRSVGLADLAQAILEGRDARCSIERTLHAVDVMTAIMASGERGEFVTLSTTCTRPEPLGIEAAKALLK